MRTILFLFAAFAVCFGSISKPTHPNEEYPKSDIGLLPGNSRIIGGSNADEGKNPWQASLRIKSSGSHTCGASIIGKRWLLCAAHCTQGSTGTYDVLINNIDRLNSNSKGKVLNITSIINHPNYGTGDGAFPNDISLIQVNEDMDYNLRIPLADPNSNSFSNCRITGWGRTCGSCALPTHLQTVDTQILSQSSCSNFWVWGSNINDGHICIQSGDTGSCNGDSGGPLVCTQNSDEVLVGATSWGASGCLTSRPSVYSSVPYFHAWITGQMTE